MNNEPMSDERLAFVRRMAHGDVEGVTLTDYSDAIFDLLAEVNRLRDAHEKTKRGAHTLGQVIEQQATDALNATGLHHLIDETGDGDWGAVWENVAELGERARRAEAALARVTDDSNPPAWIDRHGDVWVFPGGGDTGYSFETQPFSRTHIEKKWGPLTPLVRAVAAGEQDEGDERG